MVEILKHCHLAVNFRLELTGNVQADLFIDNVEYLNSGRL